MKKIKGFTLAEVLITVGVIGIVTSLTLPLINKFKPDPTKVEYLKTHDMLVKTANKIAHNRAYYPILGETTNNGTKYIVDYTNYPLANTSNVVVAGATITDGNNKFARVFENYTGLICTNCSNNTYTPYNGHTMFTTKNNVKLHMTTNAQFDKTGINESVYKTYITAVINDKEFSFILTADGKVQAVDEEGFKYLKTRSQWKLMNYSRIEASIEEPNGKFKLKTEEADRIYTPPTDNEDNGDDGDDGSNGNGNGNGNGAGRDYEDGEIMENQNKKCGDIEPGCPVHQVCCGGACYDQWNIPKYYIGASCGFKDANGNTAYVTHDTNIH